MVGGRDYKVSQFNRAVHALRSPGSAFKPVVYSLALASRMKWNDLFYVAPVAVGNYSPRASNSDFLTETTMLRAFYRSMNQPAIEISERLGIARVINHAQRLGIRSPLKSEIGTVLGGSNVTMFDLSRLYGVLANSGTLSEVISIRKIESENGRVIFENRPAESRRSRVLPVEIARSMTEGLRSVLQHGTAQSSADLATVAVGKTGTSNLSQDNWFCGYSSDVVAVVWAGPDVKANAANVLSGNTVALPIWDRFMRLYLAKHPAPPIAPLPDALTSVKIHPSFGTQSASGIDMVFFKGQEPNEDLTNLERVKGTGQYRDIFGHH
jgi:penicillin-binding protein 1A